MSELGQISTAGGRRAVIEVSGLNVELAAGGLIVIDDVSLTVAAGEILGVVGESGSGKTTVATALLGHSRRGATITAGTIVVSGHHVLGVPERDLESVRGRTIAYVPQDPATALNPALRIRTQLRELIDVHQPNVGGDERDARVRAVLAAVNLPQDDAFLTRFPHQLSGGQQQRVCIAMAFLLAPAAIVLDEPTTGLDVTTQASILSIVRRLCSDNGVAAIYVSHDLAVVAELADRVAVMYSGRIVETGPTSQLLTDPKHPYTALLSAAIPDVNRRKLLTAIPGQAAGPGRRASGCSFADRCPLAIDRCSVAPALIPVLGPGIADGPRSVACHRPGDIGLLRRDDADMIARPSFADPPILAVTGLACGYGASRVIDDVSLTVHIGECVALVGESGSGKSTLARAVVGLHQPSSGTIDLEGTTLAAHARDRTPEQRQAIQFVFQNPYASLNPRKTIGQSLATVARHFFHTNRRDTTATVVEALDSVSLPRRIREMYPDQLSGGERQRAAIARALLCRPQLLICDEVTSALDVSVQASIVRLFQQLQSERDLGILFVTHDLALVRSIADQIAVLHDGRIVESGTADQILGEPAHDYTRLLLTTTPGVGHRGDPAVASIAPVPEEST